MNYQHDDQLSKAAIKANLETLAYLERQQVKTAATIDTLRDMLRRAGVSANGKGAAPASNPLSVAINKDVKAVVERAKARFAATKRKQRPAAIRRSADEWRDALLAALSHGPRSAPGIMTVLKVGDGSKTGVYKALGGALKDRAIVARKSAGAPGANGHPLIIYALPEKAGTRTATKPRWGNKVKEQRARSLAILSAFDTTEPRANPPEHMGKIAKLISHGYLKHKGEGYVRTAKEFTV